MASTHLSLHYHLVFSSKSREPWIEPPLRSHLYEYLGGILRTEGAMSHGIGGTWDHVHVLMSLKATHCLADILQRLKSVSSRWIHEERRMPGFAWQEGYGAFTVSATSLEAVRGYVLNQEEHHRVRTFQEEYEEMLKKGLVEYNERYLW